MTAPTSIRERLQQAARILREWAGDRQRGQGKWTAREQAAIECAIDLEAAALSPDPAWVTPPRPSPIDWTCRNCEAFNIDGDVRCHKCNTLNPYAAGVTPADAEQQIADLTRERDAWKADSASRLATANEAITRMYAAEQRLSLLEAREGALRKLADDIRLHGQAQSIMSTARAYERCAQKIEALLSPSSPAGETPAPPQKKLTVQCGVHTFDPAPDGNCLGCGGNEANPLHRSKRV